MDSTIKSTTKYIRLEKLFTANLFLCLFPSLVPKYKKCFFYERNGGYLIKKPPKRNFGGFYGQNGYKRMCFSLHLLSQIGTFRKVLGWLRSLVGIEAHQHKL